VVLAWRYWRQLQKLNQSITVDPEANTGSKVIEAQSFEESNANGLVSNSTGKWVGTKAFVVDKKIIEDASASIYSFYLKPLDGQALPEFLPGQFLTFSLDLPHLTQPNQFEKISRCYSLSDAFNANYYRVSIKKSLAPRLTDLPNGRVSHYFHDQVKQGDVLQIRAPSGQFYLSLDRGPIVLIAGGIGITPLFTMLRHIQQHQPMREVWLFYGSRCLNDFMQLPELLAMAKTNPHFHLKIALSDITHRQMQTGIERLNQSFGSSVNDYFVQERISLSLLRHTLPFKPFDFYICGPAAMMETLVPDLERWGVASNKIHFEAFGPASVKRVNPVANAQATVPANLVPNFEDSIQASLNASALVIQTPAQLGHNKVVCQKSGKELLWESHHLNMLELLESHGIVVNSACRSGNCGSCQTTLLSGEIEYENLPTYTPDAGTCLICVAKPKAYSSVVLDV
jgi:ferredoxin-NADP reductase/ferredoxin